MQSCIYEGTVTHSRTQPVTHNFQYSLFMVYLDLDELPKLVGKDQLIAPSKFSSRSFLRTDHLFSRTCSLAEEVRKIVYQHTGTTSRGPVRLLTQLRYFGFYFSPLNLFYVYDETDTCVQYVLAEVSNTPWNERHCYVLWNGNGYRLSNALRFSHKKNFHVSPFMGMDQQYRWQLNEPGTSLKVLLSNRENSQQIFTARMELKQRELCRQQLRRMSFRYPMMTAQISVGIYIQACKLWWKKCPFHAHPRKLVENHSHAVTTKNRHQPTTIPSRLQKNEFELYSTPVAYADDPSYDD